MCSGDASVKAKEDKDDPKLLGEGDGTALILNPEPFIINFSITARTIGSLDITSPRILGSPLFPVY